MTGRAPGHHVAAPPRRRLLGIAAGLAAIVTVIAADVLQGTGLQYLGVLTVAPFVTAIFAAPVDVLAVGIVTMGSSQLFYEVARTVSSTGQAGRLGFAVAGTFTAVLAATVRQRGDRQLREITDIAEAAQAAILRPPPERSGALRFAARYRSATASARVGGDFYDVQATPYGVRVIVGDVRGKGLDAVRLASAVLGSFREAVFTAGPDLAAVARTVSDSTARSMAIEDFVTAVLLELDGEGRGRIVNCGHPAPLRLAPDGEVSAVEPRTPQPPLGLADVPVAEDLSLAHGERLLLFTDGIVEARDAEGRFFELERAVREIGASASREAVLDLLLDAVDAHSGGARGDDTAVLLVERCAPGHRAAGARGRSQPAAAPGGRWPAHGL
ncbi:PP2C family protein-serine/threonine phosphatase [Motilibacter deserti]|uniref:Serine/threonine-protein phosphatase n=1 Tax=Motilibacter deserti TaxID=2714956 RepID=A0ABX0GY02_9ACTN|nr:PP2C family protein-serine/threonine phosphatase [Motilibacter deserti]NHC14551.1 serine/threonine-protein phosphatase [Motilibacter deserti]